MKYSSPDSVDDCPLSLLGAVRQCLRDYQASTFTGDHPDAAVLVALLDGEDGLAVVLARRALHMPLHPGEIAFPGGKRDREDADLLATALREAEEEIGLTAAGVEILGQLDQQLTRSGFRVTPFVGRIAPGTELVPTSAEFDEVFAVPLCAFADAANIRWELREHHASKLWVPHYEIGARLIWGMTARVLVNLVNHCLSANLHPPAQA